MAGGPPSLEASKDSCRSAEDRPANPPTLGLGGAPARAANQGLTPAATGVLGGTAVLSVLAVDVRSRLASSAASMATRWALCGTVAAEARFAAGTGRVPVDDNKLAKAAATRGSLLWTLPGAGLGGWAAGAMEGILPEARK